MPDRWEAREFPCIARSHQVHQATPLEKRVSSLPLPPPFSRSRERRERGRASFVGLYWHDSRPTAFFSRAAWKTQRRFQTEKFRRSVLPNGFAERRAALRAPAQSLQLGFSLRMR